MSLSSLHGGFLKPKLLREIPDPVTGYPLRWEAADGAQSAITDHPHVVDHVQLSGSFGGGFSRGLITEPRNSCGVYCWRCSGDIQSNLSLSNPANIRSQSLISNNILKARHSLILVPMQVLVMPICDIQCPYLWSAHGLLSPPYRLDWQDSTDEDPQAKSIVNSNIEGNDTCCVLGTASKLLVAGFKCAGWTVTRFLQNRRVYARPKCPMMMPMMMTMMVP